MAECKYDSGNNLSARNTTTFRKKGENEVILFNEEKTSAEFCGDRYSRSHRPEKGTMDRYVVKELKLTPTQPRMSCGCRKSFKRNRISGSIDIAVCKHGNTMKDTTHSNSPAPSPNPNESNTGSIELSEGQNFFGMWKNVTRQVQDIVTGLFSFLRFEGLDYWFCVEMEKNGVRHEKYVCKEYGCSVSILKVCTVSNPIYLMSKNQTHQHHSSHLQYMWITNSLPQVYHDQSAAFCEKEDPARIGKKRKVDQIETTEEDVPRTNVSHIFALLPSTGPLEGGTRVEVYFSVENSVAYERLLRRRMSSDRDFQVLIGGKESEIFRDIDVANKFTSRFYKRQGIKPVVVVEERYPGNGKAVSEAQFVVVVDSPEANRAGPVDVEIRFFITTERVLRLGQRNGFLYHKKGGDNDAENEDSDDEDDDDFGDWGGGDGSGGAGEDDDFDSFFGGEGSDDSDDSFMTTNFNNDSLNDTDIFGGTYLLYAASQGNLKLLKFLVEEKKLDVSKSDFFGISPLIAAKYHERTEIVEYLFERQIREEKVESKVEVEKYVKKELPVIKTKTNGIEKVRERFGEVSDESVLPKKKPPGKRVGKSLRVSTKNTLEINTVGMEKKSKSLRVPKIGVSGVGDTDLDYIGELQDPVFKGDFYDEIGGDRMDCEIMDASISIRVKPVEMGKRVSPERKEKMTGKKNADIKRTI